MNQRTKGIIFILLSALSFATMSLFVQLSGDVPVLQKSLFRNVVAFVIAGGVLIKKRQGLHIQKGNLKFLLLRSTFGTMGVLFNFYAIENLLLSDATMINKLTPFFVIIFSFLILKEKIKLWQASAIIVAFLGSVLVINPQILLGMFISMPASETLASMASLIGVFGAMSAGMAYTMIRLLSSRGEKGTTIVFFFSAFSCIVLAPFVFLQYAEMSSTQVLYLLGAGVFASLGQFAVTAAYASAPAKSISIYDYSQIIISALYGYLVFGQIPDVYSFIGYVIVVLAAYYMYYKGKIKNATNS